VVLAWAVVSLLTSLPYLRAALAPPAGTVFLGYFYSIEDMLNYGSYVQQAEDGAFVFRNKLVPEPHPPALVNLEWWVVGRLSRLLGRQPSLAYRVFGLAMGLLFVWLADRWLVRAGLPAANRLAALLLVCLGGGLGGVLFKMLGPPAWRSLDLTTGLFPVIELMVNAHFVAGTALLMAALLALATARTWKGALLGIAIGNALGLVRPYDMVLLVVVRVLAVALSAPPREWLRRALPLAGLFPAAAYNYWVFYRSDAFRVLSAYEYAVPPLSALALGAGPAALLAATWLLHRPQAEPERTAALHLAAWAVAGPLVFALGGVSYTLQFICGYGFPLLALGALGLARYARAATLLAAAVFSATGLIALSLLLEDNPRWYVPRERKGAAVALRPFCRPGDVALSPPDVGLFVNAYAACSAFVAHPVMRDYARRQDEARAFYVSATPAWRAAFLERECLAFLALPADAGEVPAGWLGEATPYRRLASGSPGGALTLYARRPARGTCRP
jgi:hypothetical protein